MRIKISHPLSETLSLVLASTTVEILSVLSSPSQRQQRPTYSFLQSVEAKDLKTIAMFTIS